MTPVAGSKGGSSRDGCPKGRFSATGAGIDTNQPQADDSPHR